MHAEGVPLFFFFSGLRCCPGAKKQLRTPQQRAFVRALVAFSTPRKQHATTISCWPPIHHTLGRGSRPNDPGPDRVYMLPARMHARGNVAEAA